jgi:hypothetical protein
LLEVHVGSGAESTTTAAAEVALHIPSEQLHASSGASLQTVAAQVNFEALKAQLDTLTALIQSCSAKIALPLLDVEPSAYNECTKWTGSHNPGAVKPDNRSRTVFNVALSLVSTAASFCVLL